MSVVELGQFVLGLLLLVSAVSALPLFRPRLIGIAAWHGFARHAAFSMFGLSLLAFAALVYAFVISDFSVLVVAQNSHTLKPLIYKIAGAWGQHEGSLLLWIVVLSLCHALVAKFQGGLTNERHQRVLATLGFLTLGFVALSYFTSSPFARIATPPLEGQGLNPLLQDIGLVLHPPLLYVGYVGFSIAFAFAFAALLEGKFDRNFARALLPWALFAWTALTAGLALGSWWAYYELGWGGWWFWDPVENAALLPWLTGTALLHSVRVVIARASLIRWTVLLSIITFSLSLMGTFLVRSGVLTSVHAFASDPLRGFFILALLVFFTGGAFLLYAIRLPQLAVEPPFRPISREGALLLNNVLLSVAAGTVLLGTLYPLMIDALGAVPVTVGAPYFNDTFIPLMLPLLVVMPLGIFLPWRAAMIGRLRIVAPIMMGVLTVAVIAYLYLIGYRGVMALVGLAGGVWLVAGSALDIKKHWQATDRLALCSRWFGHMGLGIAILGMAGAPLYATTAIRLAPQQTAQFAGYEWQLESLTTQRGANYEARVATLNLLQDGAFVARLMPEKRYYPVEDKTTTEAAIRTIDGADLFVTLGEKRDDGKANLQLRYHPLQPLLWIGASVMVLGGLLGLASRWRRA